MDFKNMIGHQTPARDLVGGIRMEADAAASDHAPTRFQARFGASWKRVKRVPGLFVAGDSSFTFVLDEREGKAELLIARGPARLALVAIEEKVKLSTLSCFTDKSAARRVETFKYDCLDIMARLSRDYGVTV